jgi:hypothetical protein
MSISSRTEMCFCTLAKSSCMFRSVAGQKSHIKYNLKNLKTFSPVCTHVKFLEHNMHIWTTITVISTSCYIYVVCVLLKVGARVA